MLGVLYLALAALIVFVLPRGTAGLQSTFALTSQRGGVTIQAPDLVLNTAISLYLLGTLVGIAGLWQLIGRSRRTNLVLVFVVAIGIFAFLVWAVRGKSL